MAVYVAAASLHEEAVIEPPVDLLDDSRDVAGVHGLTIENLVAIQDELAVEQDEGLEALDGDLVHLIGRSARGQEALDAPALELVQGDLRRVGDVVRLERQQRTVGIKEGRLDGAFDIPKWH